MIAPVFIITSAVWSFGNTTYMSTNNILKGKNTSSLAQRCLNINHVISLIDDN